MTPDELEETISVALYEDRERISDLIHVAIDLRLNSPYPTDKDMDYTDGMRAAARMVRRGGAS